MAHRLLEIVGAGPAGLAAAIHAARHDVPVVVRERQPDVGARFHGDFQGLENWTSEVDALEELEAAGIAPTFEHAAIREQVCFDARGRDYVFRSSRPFYYLLRRGPDAGTLDCALRDQALAAGARIDFNQHVDQVPEGAVIARGPRRTDIIAVGYLFETSSADGFYGALDDRLAPRGYAYLLIHRGRGTMATCMFSDFRSERECLERTAEFFRAKVGLKMERPRRFAGVGATAPQRAAETETGVFAGEAGGFQDAVWGFGMRYAMRSGVLAARRLASLGDARSIEQGERRLKDLYRAGRVNRLIFSRLGNPGYSVFLALMARAADPRLWLGRRYAPSFVKTILAPFAGV